MKPRDEQFSESMFLTTHAWRTALDRRLRPLGFTLSRWRLLVHLSRNDGCTHKELAQHMGIEAASLVRLVDQMEGDGLLRRSSSQTDRRVKHLTLSEAGIGAVEKIRRCAAELRRELLDGIAASDIEIAHGVLNNISRKLGALS